MKGPQLMALPLTLPSYAATFAHDIAPIIFQNCAPCHRPGEAGPFSLLTFKDVKSHARQIADVTRRRYMPPWAPQAGFGKFADERRSPTCTTIKTIAAWVVAGAPEGNALETPAPPAFKEGWQLRAARFEFSKRRRPTLCPRPAPTWLLNFIIPAAVTSTRYVRAIEIRPGDKRIVHHANLCVDRARSTRRQEITEGRASRHGRRHRPCHHRRTRRRALSLGNLEALLM